jgi:hypothetical protein
MRRKLILAAGLLLGGLLTLGAAAPHASAGWWVRGGGYVRYYGPVYRPAPLVVRPYPAVIRPAPFVAGGGFVIR